MTWMRAGRIGWALWGICVTLAGCAVLLDVLRQRIDGPAADPLYGIAIVLFLSFPFIGALIATRRPQNLIGWLFCGFGITWLITSVADRYAQLSLARVSRLPGDDYAAWLIIWGWTLGLGIIATYLLLLFPDGRLPGPRWRAVAWFDALWIGSVSVFSAFDPGPIDGYEPITNPVGISLIDNVASAFEAPLYLLGLLVIGLSVSALVARFRRANQTERLQIKWITFAALLVALSLVTGVLGDELLDIGDVQWAPFPLSLINLAVFVAIAILRHNLYDIDRLINRTLVYTGLTVTLGIGFACSILLFQLILSPFTGGNDLAVAGSTLLVFALFRPLRSRLQSFVDRRFYRRRYDARQTLASFGAATRNAVDLDQLTGELINTISTTMQPEHLSVWLESPVEHAREVRP